MNPVLIPAAATLRAEFDRVAPGRDRASDGWIGDAAHSREVTDHNPDETGSVPIHDADSVNEVHAIDVDEDLRQPGLTMEKAVQHLLARCRAGAELRLRYIIYNRRIWSESSGWVEHPYTGPSPHTEHAHFSFSYSPAREASTASYHLEDIPIMLTAEDKTWFIMQIDAAATRAAARLRQSQDPGWSDTAAHNLAADAANAAAGKHVLDYWGERATENPAPAKK